MSTKNFDDMLDECLAMMETGANIDDCVAPYPDHAGELRAQLQIAQTLNDAKPQLQPEPATMARNRSILLTAAAERQQAPVPTPLLAFLLGGVRRFALLPYALPVALAVLFTLGGLTAAAAVLQPDVPVLRSVFGGSSVSSPPDASPTDNGAAQTPDGDDGSSASSSNSAGVPLIEFKDGECEVRGLITNLVPLVINGITIDDSNAEEIEGDLAQAMADGASVEVEGTSDGNICIAREIEVEGDEHDDGDEQDNSDEQDEHDDELRIEFEGGECEVRGLITSLSPLVIAGITIDDSNPERVEGDLAQAMTAGTQVRVKGTSDGNICVAREIKVENHEDDDAKPDDEQDEHDDELRIEFEGGECEVRGLITSLSPLVIAGITIDDSNPERVEGDLAQAMTAGTQVRVKGTSDGNICVADEIKVEDD